MQNCKNDKRQKEEIHGANKAIMQSVKGGQGRLPGGMDAGERRRGKRFPGTGSSMCKGPGVCRVLVKGRF